MRKNLFIYFCLCSFVFCIPFQATSIDPVVYFTSGVDLSKKFIEYVQKEPDSIKMASHRLSDLQVIRALIAAHKRGVAVEVLVDPVTITTKTPIKLLVDEGIKVLVWKADGKKGSPAKHMHHTFCVFGKTTCWTGSYTFSVKKISQHQESSLVLQDTKASADFLAEFDKMVKTGVEPFSSYVEKKEALRKKK